FRHRGTPPLGPAPAHRARDVGSAGIERRFPRRLPCVRLPPDGARRRPGMEFLTMRRALFLLPLLLLTTAATGMPATEQRLGRLVRIHGGKVWGQPDQEAKAEMREQQDIKPRMEVSTERTSVGKIALKSLCSGALTLGPSSRFRFGDEAP